MGLEQLRARLERLLATDANRSKAGLREALVELKVAAGQSRDALAAAQRELASQEQQLADAERRGKLAENIGDGETARIAGEFATKHRERIELLRRKVDVIRDELAFIEREYQSVSADYRSPGGASQPTPEPDLDDSELRNLEYRAEREKVERAVKAQLDALKKKMGRSGPSPSNGENA
jgi:hypothetical protein